jgi:hypothetical protein
MKTNNKLIVINFNESLLWRDIFLNLVILNKMNRLFIKKILLFWFSYLNIYLFISFFKLNDMYLYPYFFISFYHSLNFKKYVLNFFTWVYFSNHVIKIEYVFLKRLGLHFKNTFLLNLYVIFSFRLVRR